MTPIIPPARAAFIGLGVMGCAMAANIARAGYALAVHSRTRARAERVDAVWCDTGAEAAQGAAIIGLCVPDTPDVEAAIFGAGGIANGVSPGAIVVDFSTISASATRGFALRLAERGAILLDSPVSGGPQGAIDGTLSCMVGGEPRLPSTRRSPSSPRWGAPSPISARRFRARCARRRTS
jgi:2-hydroxy-3-oxopropionate reductase